jgi:hypothetical protein
MSEDEDFGGDDPVWTAEEIAKIIRRDRRAVYRLAKAGAIPVKVVGGMLVGGRRKLLRTVGCD